jgi:hypothetical protein
MTSAPPGWYQDPRTRQLRWWDGYAWGVFAPSSAQVAAAQPGWVRSNRKTYLGRFVWALFFAAAAIVVFWPIKESIIGTNVDCGNAFHAVGVEPTQEIRDAGLGDAAQSLANECHSDGRTRLWIGGLLVVVGIGATIAVSQWERNR